VFHEDRRREVFAFVMGVNEMTRVYCETVRCFESKERLPKSVCYILFNGTTKQPENVEYFNHLVSMITNDANVHVKLNTGLCHGESSIQQEDGSFQQQIELKFK
jgi:hypothetical protein